MDMRLGEPQRRSECYGKKQNLLFLSGIKPPSLGLSACSLGSTPTELTATIRGEWLT
jgi:hypothetical protein